MAQKSRMGETETILSGPIMLQLTDGTEVKINLNFYKLALMKGSKDLKPYYDMVFGLLRGDKKGYVEEVPFALYAGYLCNVDDIKNPKLSYGAFSEKIPFNMEYITDICMDMLGTKKKDKDSSKPLNATKKASQ